MFDHQMLPAHFQSPSWEQDIRHPKLVKLLAFWEARRHGRPVPLRKDMLPEDMGEWIGNLGIFGVEREPLRFRYRLVGQMIVDYDGQNFTGRYLDELLAPDLKPGILSQYEQCVRRAEPIAVHCVTRDRIGRPSTIDKLLLPLSTDGAHVDRVMLALYAKFERFGNGRRLLLQDVVEP